MVLRLQAIFLLALAAFGGLVAYLMRYDMAALSPRREFYVLDRWTGVIRLCSGGGDHALCFRAFPPEAPPATQASSVLLEEPAP